MAQNDRPSLPSLRTIEMARNASGGFDAEAYWVMDRRDNQLVEDEILQGAGSKSFVYKFTLNKTEVSGISVIGARHLAAHYQGLKHRIIASVQKDGALHIFNSYPNEERDMKVDVKIIPELGAEPDYYACLVELTDLKSGNTLQVEARELRYKQARDGSSYEQAHYQKIAQSKAYRNAVVNIIPQDVVLRWKQQQLALTEIITDSVIDQKRNAILTYTAKNAIPLAREAVAQLTMQQISALSDVAREKDKARFMSALDGLGLVKEGEGHEQDGQPPESEQRRPEAQGTAAKGEPPSKKEARKEATKTGTSKGEDDGLDNLDQPTETQKKGGEKPSRRSLFRDEE